MRAAIVAAVIEMVGPTLSFAQPSPDKVEAVTKADAAMMQFYPADAKAKGVEGTATITCRHSLKGALRDCALNQERPTGAGFGQAALEIAAATIDKPQAHLTPEEARQPRQIALFFKMNPPAIWPDLFLPFLRGTPAWSEVPSKADLSNTYPFAAASERASGRVEINCVASKTGAMDDCVILSEEPRGLGFGEAAMKLATHFRLKPVTDLGFSVEGFAITVPIGFNAPQLDADTHHRAVSPQK